MSLLAAAAMPSTSSLLEGSLRIIRALSPGEPFASKQSSMTAAGSWQPGQIDRGLTKDLRPSPMRRDEVIVFEAAFRTASLGARDRPSACVWLHGDPWRARRIAMVSATTGMIVLLASWKRIRPPAALPLHTIAPASPVGPRGRLPRSVRGRRPRDDDLPLGA